MQDTIRSFMRIRSLYDFMYEIYRGFPVQVLCEIFFTETETQNRFGPEKLIRIAEVQILDILDKSNNSVWTTYQGLVPDMLDHFHRAESKKAIEAFKFQRQA